MSEATESGESSAEVSEPAVISTPIHPRPPTPSVPKVSNKNKSDLPGRLLTAAVLVPLSELTRIYFGGTGGSLDLMIYGALIVLICIFKPEGLVGTVKVLRSDPSKKKTDHGDARS